MSRRHLFTIIAALLLIIVTIGAAIVVAIGHALSPATQTHVYEPPPFATPAEASKKCNIPLPPEATNIRLAAWSQWIAHETYLRFEAPVQVCLAHAAVLVPDEPLAPIPADQLAADARPPQPGIFRDISWFDLAAAQNVVAAGGGSQLPQVRVDQNRGVLYYRLTD